MNTTCQALRIPVAASVAAGMFLLLAGCAGAAQPTTPDLSPQFVQNKSEQFREEGRAEIADMFSDGVVDANDYDVAFNTFSNCFTGRGHIISDPVLSPVDNIRYIYELDSVGLDPAVVTKDQTECSSDFLEVEAMYSSTTPQVMDEPLRLAILDCMQTLDLPIDTDAKNYPEMVLGVGDDATAEWRMSLTSCGGRVATELFPELPYLPMGF